MIDLEPELIAFPVDLRAAGIDMVTQYRPLLCAIGDSPAMSDFGDSWCSAVSSISRSASNSCSSGVAAAPFARRVVCRGPRVYAVQGTDAFKNVCGQQRGNTHMQVEHFAPETGRAYHFGDAAFPSSPLSADTSSDSASSFLSPRYSSSSVRNRAASDQVIPPYYAFQL